MRRLLVLATLAVVSAGPVAAETYLYATAASQSRVDVFHVLADGSLTPSPVVQRATTGRRPRRLINRGCNLYVVEQDRVEVFRTGTGGKLERIGATRRANNMQARDVDLSEDGSMLYVPFRNSDGLVGAYPLGPNSAPNADPITEDGVPAGSPTSCVYGPLNPGWEDVAVANGKLYLNLANELFVYGLDADGKLIGTPRVAVDQNDDGVIDADEEDDPQCPYYATVPAPAETACVDADPRPKQTCPFSHRGKMHGPIGLVVDGTVLVTGPRFQDRLQGFTLDADGNFPPFGVDPADPTKEEKTKERNDRKKNRTIPTIRYLGLTLYTPDGGEPVVLAASAKGRIDSFRLGDDGTLPPNTTARSQQNVAGTPTRTAILPPRNGRNAVLYLATGELDRVQAFRLTDGGLVPTDEGPFSQTNAMKGSYPNDVVVVDVDGCP